jgi:hypothetical protein
MHPRSFESERLYGQHAQNMLDKRRALCPMQRICPMHSEQQLGRCYRGNAHFFIIWERNGRP